jgi:hypothetical protein
MHCFLLIFCGDASEFDPIDLWNAGGKIKCWRFLLHMEERRTRVFFLFYFDALKIPLTSVKKPRWLQSTVLNLAKPLLFRPLLKEDGVALEAEQLGYDQYRDVPSIELNRWRRCSSN